MAENDSKNVTGAGLKAALEAVRAKVPTAGETQRRFGSVTAENWPEIRVGDVVTQGSTEYVVTCVSSNKIVMVGGDGTVSSSVSPAGGLNHIYICTLGDDGAVTSKLLGTTGYYVPPGGKIMAAKSDMSTFPASQMGVYYPTGSKKYGGISGEITVLSCSLDGKKLQVLNGPKLERLTLDESGETPTVNYEVYPLRKPWTEEKLNAAKVESANAESPVYPGDFISRGTEGKDLIAGVKGQQVYSILRLESSTHWGLYAGVGAINGNVPPDYIKDLGRITRWNFYSSTKQGTNTWQFSDVQPGDNVEWGGQKWTVVKAAEDDYLLAGKDGTFVGVEVESTGYHKNTFYLLLEATSTAMYISANNLTYLDVVNPEKPWGTLNGPSSDCGMVFGTHEEDGGLHADVLMGHTVTSFRLSQSSTGRWHGPKVKEYEIPEKGKVEEFMAMLEKDLPHRYDMDDEADRAKLGERMQSGATMTTMKDYLLKAGDVYYNARGEDGEIIGLGEGMAVSHDVMGLPIVMILGKLYRFSPMQEAENRWISWAILTGAEATAYPAPSSEPEAGEVPGEG